MLLGANVSIGQYILVVLLPVTGGNIIGGGFFVGYLNWYLYFAKQSNEHIDVDAELVPVPTVYHRSVIDLSHFSILTSPSSYPSYKFNILHHLTAISPYFDSESNELNPDPPLGCTIDKAIYLVRHGSIYANDYDYEHTIEPFIKRLQSSLKQIDFSRSKELAFLATWNSPITNSDEQVEKLTQSGSNEAFKLGTQLASRYPNLKTKIWASSSNRTKESAASLFTGLSGNKKTIDDISIIMEEKNQGANTLSPTKTCSLFNITLGTQEAETCTDQNLYINVVHREMLPLVLTALGLYNDTNQNQIFPLNQINYQRKWKSSKFVPFLGHIALERLQCTSSSYNGNFIRILVNSEPQPLPGCASGPGASCPIVQYMSYIKNRDDSYEDFSKACQAYIDDDENHIDSTGEHRQDLCEKCIRLGRPCYVMPSNRRHQRSGSSPVSKQLHRKNRSNVASMKSPRTSSIPSLVKTNIALLIIPLASQYYTLKYGDIVQINLFNQPTIIISNSDFADYILRRNGKNYTLRFGNQLGLEYLGMKTKGIIWNQNIQRWKYQRLNFFQKSLNSKILDDAKYVSNDTVDYILKYLNYFEIQSNIIDIMDLLRAMTFTITCHLFLDLPIGSISIEKTKFYVNSIVQYFKAWEYFLLKPTEFYEENLTIKHEKSVNDLNNVVEEIILQRDLNQNCLFINSLIQSLNNNQITKQEMNQCILEMLIAGTDTSSVTMFYFLLALADRKDLENDLLKELKNNSYLLLINGLKESMRYKPVGPVIMRCAIQNDIYKNISIQQGTNIIINLVDMHTKSDEFLYPNQFNLINVRDKDLSNINSERNVFLPFGIGPKECVGRWLAKVEMETIIEKLILNYSFQRANQTKTLEELQTRWDIAQQPTHPGYMFMKKR
ncbi:hypothetical protein I4U23_010655 [Adineta vaga]|nr:hypothetical protein I4U23_010655 [Adineta vaga]